MNTQSPDTNVKAEQMLISLLREKSAAKKFAMIRLSQSTIQLSKRAIARANEGIEDDQLNVLFIDLHYGKELAEKFKTYIDEKHENA